jgi:hypothetical protein
MSIQNPSSSVPLGNHQQPADFDGGVFTDNQNRFPATELLKYAGQWVAWSLDGTQIVASGKDEAALLSNLQRVGIDPSRVVQGRVEPMDGTVHL